MCSLAARLLSILPRRVCYERRRSLRAKKLSTSDCIKILPPLSQILSQIYKLYIYQAESEASEATLAPGQQREPAPTNQIMSTHFYPGFVSWLVKLAPVAQISWHQHPSHHHHQHWSTFINQNTGYSYSHTLHWHTMKAFQWYKQQMTKIDGIKKEWTIWVLDFDMMSC